MSSNEIIMAKTDEDITLCFPVYKELRPHLNDKASFVQQVKRQQASDFTLIFIKQASLAVACAGYRPLEMLAWGKIVYIDDLITLAETRGKGYGGLLLNYIESQAKLLSCSEIHLDTGYTRFNAHRLYLRHGFHLNCHHLSKVIGST